MGLKQNTSNVTYLKFKDGLFYSSKDKEVGYNEFEGFITNFSIVDEEYNNIPSRKLVLKMTDTDGDNYILKVNFETAYATSLISFLKNANLSESLSLVGTIKEDKENDRKISGILVKQGGNFLKGYFTKDNPNGLPQMKQVTVNKKKVWDKSEMLEFLEELVLNEFNSNVAKVEFQKTAKVETPVTADGSEDDDEEGAEDLPF